MTTVPKISLNHCYECNAKKSKTVPVRKCTRCMAVAYCSIDCQKANWKSVHNNECMRFAEVTLLKRKEKDDRAAKALKKKLEDPAYLVALSCQIMIHGNRLFKNNAEKFEFHQNAVGIVNELCDTSFRKMEKVERKANRTKDVEELIAAAQHKMAASNDERSLDQSDSPREEVD